jgi:hypothetical protein
MDNLGLQLQHLIPNKWPSCLDRYMMSQIASRQRVLS